MASRFAALSYDDSDEESGTGAEEINNMPGPMNTHGAGGSYTNAPPHVGGAVAAGSSPSNSPNVTMTNSIDHTETTDFTTQKRRGNNNNNKGIDNTHTVGTTVVPSTQAERSPSPKKKEQINSSNAGGAGLGGNDVANVIGVMSPAGIDGLSGTKLESGGSRKKRTGAVNRFAALNGDDDSDASDNEESTHETEYTPVAQQQVAPLKPKDIMPKESGADLFGVLSMEFTQPLPATDPRARKFKSECTKIQALFVSSRTQKIEFEFSELVRPTEFPQPELKTAQALDEVLRQFDKFLKDNSLVPMYKANKRGGKQSNSFGTTGREFAIVTCGPDHLKNHFLQECTRKSAALTVSPAFKKWVDIQAILVEAYDLQKNATLQDALHKVCLEYEGKEDGKNVAKLLGCLIRDIPTRLIANQQAK